MKKVYFVGKLYYKAWSENWSTSFAYYLYLSSKFPHKFIKTSVLTSVEKRHVTVLIKQGLASISKGYLSLCTFKKMQLNHGGRLLFTSEKLCTITDFKNFIKIIALQSNIRNQKKKIEQKKHFFKIKHKINNNYSVSGKDYRFYKKNQNVFDNDLNLRLSIDGVCRVQDVSRPTAIKYKKHLKEFTNYYFKRCIKIFKFCSFNDYLFYKRIDNTLVYNYINGYCFNYKASEIKKSINMLM